MCLLVQTGVLKYVWCCTWVVTNHCPDRLVQQTHSINEYSADREENVHLVTSQTLGVWQQVSVSEQHTKSRQMTLFFKFVQLVRNKLKKYKTKPVENLTPGFQKSSAKMTSDAAERLMPAFAAVILSTATRTVSSRWNRSQRKPRCSALLRPSIRIMPHFYSQVHLSVTLSFRPL